MNALLIETESAEIERLGMALQMGWPGVKVIVAGTAADALPVVQKNKFDVVLLDPDLPDLDGFDLLVRLRCFSSVPVIVITGRAAEMDRVRGLEQGADDYIVRPIGQMELMARVRALLRRNEARRSSSDRRIDLGPLSIDPHSHLVKLQGKDVKLTPIEYKLLAELVSNTGHIVPHQALIRKVWGEEYLDTPDILKVHIHRLRRKLKLKPDDPEMIVTVSGRGYRFDDSLSNGPALADSLRA